MNNTNLYPLSHRFRVIAAHWSNYLLCQACLYLTRSFVANLWTLDCEIWP